MKGLGDTIEVIAKAVGADKVVKVIEKVVGKPCGCKERKEKLNKVFPYNK
jgi:hypothetical protein